MDNSSQSVERARVIQDIVERIQVSILNGEMSVGEQLPTEEEMGKRFNTDGATIHEVLRILTRKSLVEFVSGAAELTAENLAMLIRSHNLALEHLAEFREGVEGTVSALAATRATAADNKKLAALIDEAAGCCERGTAGWGSFVQVDERVHKEIAGVAGNPLYTFVVHSVHENIHRYYDKYLIIGEFEMEENYQDLQLIVAAIADHDAETARKLAVEHVRRFSRYMAMKKRQSADPEKPF